MSRDLVDLAMMIKATDPISVTAMKKREVPIPAPPTTTSTGGWRRYVTIAIATTGDHGSPAFVGLLQT